MAKSVTDCNIDQYKIIVFVEAHRKISKRKKNLLPHLYQTQKQEASRNGEFSKALLYQDDIEMVILDCPEHTKYKLSITLMY